jgi:transposase InsO family protein
VNPRRVQRLLREDNLPCVRKRKFIVTTDSNRGRKVYPNLTAAIVLTGVDQLWRVDIHLHPAARGVRLPGDDSRCLPAAGNRWTPDRNMELTSRGLRMALSPRSIKQGLVHHSDRGSQYASNDCTDLLKAHRIDIGISRKGNLGLRVVYENTEVRRCSAFS